MIVVSFSFLILILNCILIYIYYTRSSYNACVNSLKYFTVIYYALNNIYHKTT